MKRIYLVVLPVFMRLYYGYELLCNPIGSTNLLSSWTDILDDRHFFS